MEINSISLPPREKNIAIVREFAREKDLSLHKVPNKELWDLIDPQTKECVLYHKRLIDVHVYLCHCDD